MTGIEKFDKLVDVIVWGVDFQRDFSEEGDGGYTLGTLETTGFIASCCIVQWFGTEGIGGCDVCTALKLHKWPKRKKIRRRLRQLLLDLGVDEQLLKKQNGKNRR